jgi:hypothetical protein
MFFLNLTVWKNRLQYTDFLYYKTLEPWTA